MQKITTFLWFDNNAEEAMTLYTSIFPNSRILETHMVRDGGDPNSGERLLTASFELDGQEFMALNGGPQFAFTEAVSLFVHCEDQAEIDHYWNSLTADGGEESMCGWLKDKFGLSWQITPNCLIDLLGDPDPGRSERAMQAMLQMHKLDIKKLQDAADGKSS